MGTLATHFGLWSRILNCCFRQATQNLHRASTSFWEVSPQNNLGSFDFKPPTAELLLGRNIHMAAATQHGQIANSIKKQEFDYFLVLDFEATCEQGVRLNPQEIIEFPVLKVNGKSFEVEAQFHQYVTPQIHTELSSFCTELTGIVQDMVTGQPTIEETLQKFHAWMEAEGLTDEGRRVVFVTCGDWDLKTMLPGQADYFGFSYPDYLRRWINIKKSYASLMRGHFPRGMMEMLEGLSVKHQGRHHSGIDDCHNIARILKALANRGALFKATGSIH